MKTITPRGIAALCIVSLFVTTFSIASDGLKFFSTANAENAGAGGGTGGSSGGSAGGSSGGASGGGGSGGGASVGSGTSKGLSGQGQSMGCSNGPQRSGTLSPIARNCCSGRECDASMRCTTTTPPPPTPKPAPKPAPKPIPKPIQKPTPKPPISVPIGGVGGAANPGGAGGAGSGGAGAGAGVGVGGEGSGGFTGSGSPGGGVDSPPPTSPWKIDIKASPTRVSRGDVSTITWTSSLVEDCRVEGPGLSVASNADSRDVVIENQSVFTLTCDTDLGAGVRWASDRAVVRILPTFIEI